MYRCWFVLVFTAVVWLVGCQERLPVELVLEQSPNAVEVMVLPAIDSTLIVDAPVDTSGVLQWEEQVYPATFIINGVKTDLGSHRSSFSYARILINDKRNPIRNLGKVIGYLGLDVGKAKVNSTDLPKMYRPFRTWSSFSLQVNAGPAYTLVDQENQPVDHFTFTPGQRYQFVADGRGPVSAFELSIQSPDEITIDEPKAGSIILRSEDLQLRWHGKAGESFRVVVGLFNARSNVGVQPHMQINIKEGENSVVVPAKVLQALQGSQDGRYLLSFISSNRREANIPGYSEKVLVQAASIHNILLWLK